MAYFSRLQKIRRGEPNIKSSNIQIPYDTEKLNAIRQYGKGETELQAGMEVMLQKLYEKYVPAKVREMIDSRKK